MDSSGERQESPARIRATVLAAMAQASALSGVEGRVTDYDGVEQRLWLAAGSVSLARVTPLGDGREVRVVLSGNPSRKALEALTVGATGRSFHAADFPADNPARLARALSGLLVVWCQEDYDW